ncbi:unnamed protein product [Phytophthora lilii]|uniref:Unnamed protein product n=1 Tax=Phytophthora lilii TaxID=2077276 RepID=A0A9W6TWY0_9STRA|nr:unnamed protein product [Phytophthora lilii]
MKVFMWQVALTFIYPLEIFGFSSLSGISQTLFVLMLPTIKTVGEGWISYTLADQNDIKPEVVIFNVEVFNALYVSCAVQTPRHLPQQQHLCWWMCYTFGFPWSAQWKFSVK